MKRLTTLSIRKGHCLCWLLGLSLLLAGCEHRPLHDRNTGHYIRIYVNEEIKNVTCGFYNETLEHPEYNRPTVMRVVLSDPDTDALVTERFLQNQGEDERGYYIDGYINAPAGNYNLLVYSFGSATTLIRNERSFYAMEAYTNSVSTRMLGYIPQSRQELDEKSIVYEPEHLFHDVGEPIVIPETYATDTLRTASGDHFTAHSVVLSYYLQVRIKGIEWVTSAVSLLSGMAGSTLLHGHRQMVETNPVHLFFDMNYTDKQRSKDGDGNTAILYTTFSTFGKLPSEATIYTLNFEFMKTDGSSQVEKLEITPMFNTPLVKNEQWILLDHEIVITPPSGTETGGGMTPGVEEWDEVESDVYI